VFEPFHFDEEPPPALVQREYAVDVSLHAAVLDSLLNEIRVISYELDIEHFALPLPQRRRGRVRPEQFYLTQFPHERP
jgi:hypothetical protein